MLAMPIVCDTIADNAYRLWPYCPCPYHPRRPPSATPIVDDTMVHSILPTYITCGPIDTDPIARGHAAGYANRPS